MSQIVAIADAVVASLNGADFPVEFTAVRKYQPETDLAALSELLVSVVPRSLVTTRADRKHDFFDYAIDVGVQQKLGADSEDRIGELLELVEVIGDHLRTTPLDGAPEAIWIDLENEPVYAPNHLQEMRVFTSVLTATYRMKR